ncbi:hypothetical protein HYH03_006260 [Edaphochlamys debaryana]|uniref:Fe2OG dioxygenase domain-containing protein n=1 Tax=Edaphochlamys debaryana TaxID=47281 RepID=A0A835Y412_9CHLO|nr:hypothetical protein HYH03_006260 [Edaphochlamys debaryana]|eukprot:KAG2495660.1 hypothetical protein HYH03_006260 [Edaphochlamys debaryana]
MSFSKTLAWALLLVALLEAFRQAHAVSYDDLIGGIPDSEDEPQLIGWQGEKHRAQEDGLHSLHSPNDTSGEPWIQVISWKPRAAIYHNFLSDREAKHIVNVAKSYMQRSQVVSKEGISEIRTSYGTFIRRNFDPVIAAVEERVSLWSQLPVSHQEDLQVLRYGPTNKYGAHLDGEERVATVLIYLVEPDEGGETAFVNSQWMHKELGQQVAASGLSKCAQGHVTVKPKRGDALIFYDLKPDFKTLDPNGRHTGCPVIKGVKWNAVKWIHGKPYDPESYETAKASYAPPRPDPGDCGDYHKQCKKWADGGECKKNPGYMQGGSGQLGTCRLACGACEVCEKGDEECTSRNRQRGGFLDLTPEQLAAELKGL